MIKIVSVSQSDTLLSDQRPTTDHRPPLIRIGLARDEAFSCYYARNLDILADQGVEWVPFSPLADAYLPPDLDGLYFGGGNCEGHSVQLSENDSLQASIRDFAAANRPIYAEGSALVFLGRSFVSLDGRRHPMAGILPLDTAEMEQVKMAGRVELQWAQQTLWGPPESCLRGFEFRRFDILAEDGVRDGWQRPYSVHKRRAGRIFEGFARNRILASFVHLYWAASDEAVKSFVSQMTNKEASG